MDGNTSENVKMNVWSYKKRF